MTLDCSFVEGPFYSIVGAAYQCKVQNTTIVVNDYKIVNSINGIHHDMNSNLACQMLWVYGTIFNYIPRGIGDHFENLEAIWIQHGGLKELSNLEQFPNLRFIYARYNNLRELRSDVFKNNPTMEWLDLKYNNLTFIDGQIFLPFKNLTNLNFEYNYCIDNHYHAKLRSDYNYSMPVWKICHEINVNCHRPEELFCAMETISHQGTPYFTCHAKGTDVNDRNSTLSRILFNQDEKKTLETQGIYIRYQHFKHFPNNLHTLLPNLQAIQIIGSELKELTFETMKNFPELRSLWLPLNHVEILLNGIFEKNPKLEKLSFYGNRLKMIGSRVLMPLKNLIFASFEKTDCIDMSAWSESLNELKNQVAIKCDEEENS